jgi:hypothetical protein
MKAEEETLHRKNGNETRYSAITAITKKINNFHFSFNINEKVVTEVNVLHILNTLTK